MSPKDERASKPLRNKKHRGQSESLKQEEPIEKLWKAIFNLCWKPLYPTSVSSIGRFSMDGKANVETAGCGGTLRTATAIVRVLFSGPDPFFGSDFAEVVAIKTMLEVFVVANCLGKAGLIVDSDSHVVGWSYDD
ncbi:hypothetical protein V6N13_017584 [Hibiscus sabdariffa]